MKSQRGMEHRLCSTQEFWEAMCGSGFVRLSKHRGANRNVIYLVTTPPEELPGFMENQVAATLNLLAPPKGFNWFGLYVFVVSLVAFFLICCGIESL